MSDDFSEVSSQGWLGRIVESIKGVAIGILLFLISIPLLAWNEYRAVTTYESLKEGGGALVSVDAGKVDPDNEGKFIHLTGEAKTDETLEDPDFHVSAAKVIHLKRKVEMYQWKENKTEKTEKKLGGRKETTTTYSYEKVWSEKPIDSSAFNQKWKKKEEEKHPSDPVVNPPMEYKSKAATAKKVTLGAFTLPLALYQFNPDNPDATKIKNDENLPVSASAEEGGPPGFKPIEGGKRLYKGNPDSPKVGDVRVQFTVTKPAEVSVYGKQYGETLEEYPTKAGDRLLDLRMGKMSGAAMIEAAQGENVTLTWILRLVGFILMAVGVYMVFQPLVVVADVVPFIGDLLSAGATLVAILVALPLTLITIAISWIAVRPLVGIPLLLGAVLLIAGGVYLSRKRHAARAASHSPPPR